MFTSEKGGITPISLQELMGPEEGLSKFEKVVMKSREELVKDMDAEADKWLKRIQENNIPVKEFFRALCDLSQIRQAKEFDSNRSGHEVKTYDAVIKKDEEEVKRLAELGGRDAYDQSEELSNRLEAQLRYINNEYWKKHTVMGKRKGEEGEVTDWDTAKEEYDKDPLKIKIDAIRAKINQAVRGMPWRF